MGYGNKEKVPLHYLSSDGVVQTLAHSQAQHSKEANDQKKSQSSSDGQTNLKKDRPSSNKRKRKPDDVTLVQRSWQKFVHKGAKRGLSGVTQTASGRGPTIVSSQMSSHTSFEKQRKHSFK